MFVIHATPWQILKYSVALAAFLAVAHDAWGWWL